MEIWTQRQTHTQGRCQVMTKAEIGVMQPQVKDWGQPPEAGRGKEGPSPTWHADTLTSDFWPLTP